jgi:hypothetical protein
MSITSTDAPVPLLSALRVRHGPREVLGRYFLDVAMELRQRGIEVLVSRDVDRFAKLGGDYEQARPPRFPAMDAASAGFGPENWFTLEGRDAQDRLAFFGAARLLRLRGSLKEEIESFQLLYWEPETQRQSDDAVEVTAPSVPHIGGFVALLGSYWVAPRLRGTGLARVFPNLCRYYAFTLWPIDHAIGFMRQHEAERGLSLAYGEPPPERWVKFRGRWSDDSYIGCNSRDGIERSLYASAAEAKSRATLTADTLDSSSPPSLVRQGRISR